MEAVDDYVPMPERDIGQAVSDADGGCVLDLGTGTVVTGRVEPGGGEVGEEMEIVGFTETRRRW